MRFSESTMSKAIESHSGELAWKREDVFKAVDELAKNGYAILGGDVWAVMTEFSPSETVLTKVDSNKVAVGLLKGKDGETYVFNWHTDRKKNESWNHYITRSQEETLEAIKDMNAEQTVSEKYQNQIFYNLVYSDELEFQKLK